MNVHANLKPNADAIRQHLELLFGNVTEHSDGKVEIAVIAKSEAGSRVYAKKFEVDELDAATAYAVGENIKPGHNVYVGAALRSPNSPVTGRAEDKEFYALYAVYVDLDDREAVETAREAWTDCKPHIVFLTGTVPHARVQTWWRLDEPITNPKEMRSTIRGMAIKTAGDKMVTNPSRIMRLAGTIAWPAKPERVIELTQIVPLNEPPTGNYSIEQIHRWAAPADEDSAGTLNAIASDDDPVREAGLLGMPGKVIDHRELYMRDTVLAMFIELTGTTGAVPTIEELFDAAWDQYKDHVSFDKPGRGPNEVVQKCRYTLHRFESGDLYIGKKGTASFVPLPDIEAVEEAYRSGRHQQFTPQGMLAAPVPRQSCFFSACTLSGKPVPLREWLVKDLVPQKTVTLLSGDGGTGKSLLALQLAIATATGTPWISKPVQQGRVIFMSAKDDADELHRRTADIVRESGLNYSQLDGLTMRSLAGEDALLAMDEKLRLVESALFAELEKQAEQDSPTLIVIDTLADVYPANENDRAKVRQFIGILRGLALRRECAVLLLGHPSLSGLSSGSGMSGSTAWNNSVRSRLYLERVKETDYEADPDKRLLSTKKANYGRVGEEISLTWRSGMFVADRVVTGVEVMAVNMKAERVFLKLLAEFKRQGRRVNSSSGINYAPKQFAEHPRCRGCHQARTQGGYGKSAA